MYYRYFSCKNVPEGFLALPLFAILIFIVEGFFFKAVFLLVVAIVFFSTLLVATQLGFEKDSFTAVDCFATIIAFSAASLIYTKFPNYT